MGAEAKLYLQEHRIPQLFEGLMTGLIYNRPQDPITFLEQSLQHVKRNPDHELSWDMFIEKGITSSDRRSIASKRVARPISKDPKTVETSDQKRVSRESRESRERTSESGGGGRMGLNRTPSVIKAAQVAEIPSVPIILFMGGPGGGKTRHAAKVASSLADKGLVHICMPDVIRQALARYKDKYQEWKDANDHYMRGELIPNHLALALVKAEMGRHKNATAFFLEGFPREARQVEDFERQVNHFPFHLRIQVKSVNMALIIDYDEKTLRDHMEKRGLGMEIIDQKIKEFKQKTLPSAKYFDDQKLLHLIPGERDDQTIYERMKGLVIKAMDTGVPVINSNPPSQQANRENPVEAPKESQPKPVDPPPSTDAPPGSQQGQRVVEKPPTPPPVLTPLSLSQQTQRVEKITPPPVEKVESAIVEAPSILTKPSVIAEKPPPPVIQKPVIVEPEIPKVAEAPKLIESPKLIDPETPKIVESVKSNVESELPLTTTPLQPPPILTKIPDEDRIRTPPPPKTEEEIEAQLASVPSLGAMPRPPSAEVRVIPPTAEPNIITTTATIHNSSRPTSVQSRKSLANGNTRNGTETPRKTPPRTSSSHLGHLNLPEVPRGLPNNAPVILLVGAPGALKNEVAKRITQKYDGFVLISMGEILRKNVIDSTDDELWKRVNNKIQEGEPVPTKLCRQLLYTEIHNIGQGAWGYVIEGFPRNMAQLEDFEAVVSRIDVAILIDCTEQFCEEMVKKRYEESDRKDDSPEVFKVRLAAFKQNTLPMLKHLDEKSKLRVVDGDGDADSVFKEVSQVIDAALFIEEDDGSGHSLDESKKGSLNTTQQLDV